MAVYPQTLASVVGRDGPLDKTRKAQQAPPIPLQSTMIPDVILFTSPKAGSGAAREQIPRLMSLLSNSKYSAIEISSPEKLKEVANQCQQSSSRPPIVIAAGGDGTLSLVASIVSPETPLLPMPLGTENLLARQFGHSNHAEEVFKTLESGRACRLDAGEANGRLFLIMATIGFDADVVRRLHLRRKGHIRRVSYFAPILKSIYRYRFPELNVETFDEQGQSVDQRGVGWAMVFNLPCYAANLRIAPEAIGDDGKLDLVTFARRGIINGLRYVLGVLAGRHHRYKDVDSRRISEVIITADERVAFELDGDYAGKLPLTIKTIPDRITLMVRE